jgi:hypothetical protein
MSNISSIGRDDGEGLTYPDYFNYEIVLKPITEGAEPTTINDYGFLVNNGVITAICRGPVGKSEIMTSVNNEDVYFAKAISPYRANVLNA